MIFELEPVLDAELVEEATVRHDPAECRDYAGSIEQAVSAHLDKRRVEHLANAAQRVAVWLRYWGELKAGFWPSF